MSPALIAELIAQGSKLTTNLIDAIPNEYDREEKRRLEELRRKQDIGALGLTQKELDILTNAANSQQQAQLQSLEAARKQQMTAAGAGAGEALKAATATEGASRQVGEQTRQKIEEMDVTRRREQERELEDEYWARVANKAEAKRARVKTGLGATDNFIKFINDTVQTKATMEGNAPTKRQVAAWGGKFGLSEEESSILLQKLIDNPEMLTTLQQLL